MPAPIYPNPENATQDELRVVQRATADFEMGQRIMAIIMLLNGIDRDLVIKSLGCHANSLRNWVVAFNQSGIDGLATHPRSGRPPILHKGQRLVLSELFARPQDLDEEFWTKRKFHGVLTRELQVELGYPRWPATCVTRAFVSWCLVPQPPIGTQRHELSSWNGFSSTWITIPSSFGSATNRASWPIRVPRPCTPRKEPHPPVR